MYNIRVSVSASFVDSHICLLLINMTSSTNGKAFMYVSISTCMGVLWQMLVHFLVEPTLCRLIGGERRDAVEFHRFQHVVNVAGYIGGTAFAVLYKGMLKQDAVLGAIAFLLDQTGIPL